MAAYVYAFRLQSRGISYPSRLIADYLLSGPLRGRNDASIRYRMRNISYVLHVRGRPTIRIYSPAPQVGSGVRTRIERILDSQSEQGLYDLSVRQGAPPIAESQTVTSDQARSNAIEKLRTLQSAIDDLEVETGNLEPESEVPGIGHNNPPEQMDGPTLSRNDLRNTADVVEQLSREINSDAPDENSIETKKNLLLQFGLKLSVWLGDRLTNFTDAALKTLAPILVAKITGVLPHLIEAVEAIGRFLQALIN